MSRLLFLRGRIHIRYSLLALKQAGDSYKMMEEWALAAKGWGTEINLVPRQDEAVADNDFKAGVIFAALRASNT
jgi:hypothetical protein